MVSKIAQRLSFIPLDEKGRCNVPLKKEVYTKIYNRGQSLAEVVYVTMSTYLLAVPSVPLGAVEDMTRSVSGEKFARVRVTVPKPICEACCYTLKTKYPRNSKDWEDAWNEFSSLAERIADSLFLGSMVTEVREAKSHPQLVKTFRSKVKVQVRELSEFERELEAAKAKAEEELLKFRNENHDALQAASKELKRIKKLEKKSSSGKEKKVEEASKIVEEDMSLMEWSIVSPDD